MSSALQSVLGATASLVDGWRTLDRDELLAAAQHLATQLQAEGTRVLATLLDNGLPWLLADLAATEAGLVHVPLPLFFSPEQLQHALAASGVTPRRRNRWRNSAVSVLTTHSKP